MNKSWFFYEGNRSAWPIYQNDTYMRGTQVGRISFKCLPARLDNSVVHAIYVLVISGRQRAPWGKKGFSSHHWTTQPLDPSLFFSPLAHTLRCISWPWTGLGWREPREAIAVQWIPSAGLPQSASFSVAPPGFLLRGGRQGFTTNLTGQGRREGRARRGTLALPAGTQTRCHCYLPACLSPPLSAEWNSYGGSCLTRADPAAPCPPALNPRCARGCCSPALPSPPLPRGRDPGRRSGHPR